jgi:hypothetical protein
MAYRQRGDRAGSRLVFVYSNAIVGPFPACVNAVIGSRRNML